MVVYFFYNDTSNYIYRIVRVTGSTLVTLNERVFRLKQYSASQIRNLAILGHGGSGKTTLADAILCFGKATERIGKTADSTTVMDFDPEEKKRKVSVSAAVYPLETASGKLNIIDAPGLFDFAGGAVEAVSAADSVLIAMSGKSGLTVGAEQSFDRAKAAGKPVCFFVGKLDSSHAHFYRVVSSLTGKYGGVICPVSVPYIENEQVECFVDLVHNKAFKYSGGAPAEVYMPESEEITRMRELMLEAVASLDEALMDKYFSGEVFTPDEIVSALSKGTKAGDICPVFCGINQTGEGVDIMMRLLEQLIPTAAETTAKAKVSGEETELKPDESAPAAAYVFKTIADPFVGKLSYFKVVSGKIASDTKLVCARTGEEEKLAKVMYIKAGKQEDAAAIVAGDIGCASKLGDVLTGDTLSSVGSDIVVVAPEFPNPCLKTAVFPKKKGDEEKIASGLARLAEEDPTIKCGTDRETKEMILETLGEQHTDVIVSKLKTKFGVEVELKKPKVAYRETIRGRVKVQGRHKKQSGGHGQFGDVWIEFEPCESDDLVFEEKVFGGAVPKNFFPAVEKGLRDSVKEGVLAGYPMVGIKATLVDGSYHPVDSSEMAFKTAAGIAFREGIPQAKPVILEPIGTLKVTVNDDALGDVIGDINKRRGRVIGMDPKPNKLQEVTAEVPIAEMSDFATAMRSITQGRAVFTLNFERYEEVPPQQQGKIIEDSRAGN